MEEREAILRRWFSMWLEGQAGDLTELFALDVQYIESWGPEYHGVSQVRHWFEEWNTRGKVLAWDIRGFFHREDRTVVEWYFENKMETGKKEGFEGISLIEWTDNDKIKSLKEFGCNCNRYNPYQTTSIRNLFQAHRQKRS